MKIKLIKKRSFKARILSGFLAMSLVASVFTNPFLSLAKDDTITILAGGDYQCQSGNEAGETIVAELLAQVKSAGHDTVDGFLSTGDYDYEYTGTTEGITSLKNVVQSTYATLADQNMFFVQGNHDVAGATGLSPSGANDTADYGVYVIHEDEYPWLGGDEWTVKNTAVALESYLQAKVEGGNTKPIFILSHLPLHYNMRTNLNGDGKYAKYIFDVINKYGAKGQNIIFLYGHNHNDYGFDDYLGGSAVYLTHGDTIYVGQEGDVQAVPSAYQLNFTYMNSGYISYNYSANAGADKALTMTVFQIKDNVVTVERYSASGLHNMKSAGVWSSYAGETKATYGAEDSYLSTVYQSPQIIETSVTDENVKVIGQGLTKLVADKNDRKEDAELHTAYMAYDLSVPEYTPGTSVTVKVTIPEDEGFDANKQVFIKESNKDTISYANVQNGAVTFETDQLGSFELMQFQHVFEENSNTTDTVGYLESREGYVKVNADASAKTGSKLILSYPDGTISVVDITLDMLRDAEGNVITTDTIAQQDGLQVFYEDSLIYDNYTLYVHHENGVNYLNVSEYRSEDVYTYPQKEGYVFAGWYQDAEFKNPLSKEKKTDYAYAKFVDENVLTVKGQLTTETTTASEQTNLRMITTVDTLDYQNVGFDVTIYGKTIRCTTNTVYKTVGAFVDGKEVCYEPTVFSYASAYFTTHKITGIPNSAFLEPITIEPIWITLDGTEVKGNQNSAKVITIGDLAEPYIVDFEEGVDFERAADLNAITPYNGSNGFSALWGGNYANASLQTFNNSTQLAITGTNSSAQWPTFYVNFGKTYPAGTVLTFNCYYDSTGNSEGSLHEMVSGQSEPVKQHTISWIGRKTVTELSFTLENACDRIAILTTVHAGSTMYYDDFKVVTPIDFEEGVDFEESRDASVVSGSTGSNVDASYGGEWGLHATEVSRVEFDGSNVIKAIPTVFSNGAYPTIHVEFGKTYPAGSVLTYRFYIVDIVNATDFVLREYQAGQVNVSKTHQSVPSCGQWVTQSVILENACNRISIFATVWSRTAVIYFDDFKIDTPIDFEKGVDFEESRDVAVVSGSTGSNVDASYGGEWGPHMTEVSRVEFDGSNVIKATPKSFVNGAAYPTIHVEFDKTYPAGSVLTYRFYIADSRNFTDFALREYQVGQASVSKEHQSAQQCGQWITQSVTLENACNRISIFATVWSQTAVIYFDDFVMDADVSSLYTAVKTGQKLYFGAITEQNALKTQLYDQDTNLIRTVTKEELFLIEDFGGTYGIYCYTVNSDDIKYVYTPHDKRAAYYATVLKNADDTTTQEEIVKEMIDMFGVQTPSANTVNVLSGKSALFVGDSITAGVCDYNNIYAATGWAGRIGYHCDMTVKNNGVSGACISTQRVNSSESLYIYNNLVKENGNAYDYVIMHGLYNDVGTGVAIGTPQGKANFNPETADVTQFAQALELLFYTAQQNQSTAKLGFIINYKTKDGVNCDAHVAMAIQICKDWGIEYLDLYNDGTDVEQYDYLHATSKGYDSIYSRIADWMAGM